MTRRRPRLTICRLAALGVLALAAATTSGHAGAQEDAAALRDTLSTSEAEYARAVRLYGRGAEARPAAREAAAQAAAQFRSLIAGPAAGSAWAHAAAGSAEMLADNRGLALLAYRRAARIDPHGRAIRENLAVIRNSVQPDAPPPPERDWIAIAGESIRIAPLGVRAGAVIAAWGLAWALVLVRLVGGRVRPPSWLITSLFGASALGGGALALDELAWVRENDVVVLSPASLRSGPDDVAFEPVANTLLPAGTEADLLGRSGAWARIALGDGRSGWVRESSIEPVAPLPGSR